jgi:D-sedoheptulose 7-phosphate isomerase
MSDDLEARLEATGKYLEASLAVQRRVVRLCATQIVQVSEQLAEALRQGNKVMLCGNGGSAADCQHMAAELMGRLSRDVERPGMAAIALTTDTSFLTAYANDFDFNGVFERQVSALGSPGDVLIAISTSGRSENVMRAVRMAKTMRIATIGLIGEGGPLTEEVEYAVVIPDRDTQHVQEALLPVEHIVCLLIEQALFGKTKATD